MPIPTTTVTLHRDFEVKYTVLFVRELERKLEKPLSEILDQITAVHAKIGEAQEAASQTKIFADVPVEQAAAFVSACVREPVETILAECSMGQVYAAYFALCGGLVESLSDNAGKA